MIGGTLVNPFPVIILHLRGLQTTQLISLASHLVYHVILIFMLLQWTSTISLHFLRSKYRVDCTKLQHCKSSLLQQLVAWYYFQFAARSGIKVFRCQCTWSWCEPCMALFRFDLVEFAICQGKVPNLRCYSWNLINGVTNQIRSRYCWFSISISWTWTLQLSQPCRAAAENKYFGGKAAASEPESVQCTQAVTGCMVPPAALLGPARGRTVIYNQPSQ